MYPVVIASLIEQRKALCRDIERRERTRREAGAGDCDPMLSEDALLFERLLKLCQTISLARQGELQGQ